MRGHVTILCIIIIIIAAAFIISGGEVVPIRVNGLVNQSIILSPSVDTSHPVQEVYWTFQIHIMAYFINGKFAIKKKEFKGRLEMLDDGRTLRIGQLTLDDSGIYSVTMTFMDNTSLEASFSLTVYEPVPTPSITIEAMEKTSDWCNVTLRCSVPRNTTSMSYTWKYRHGDSDYQQYNNSGDTIQMSLQPKSWDMEVLCIVNNPTDQKNVSQQKFCLDYASGGTNRRINDISGRGYYGYLGFLAILVVPVVVLGWWYLKMKRKPRKGPQSTSQEEVNYAELKLEAPNVHTQEHNREDVNTPLEPCEVVYSTLAHGT